MGPLLPEWLEVGWVAVFAAIGCSHLRHMHRTDGQRRAWHACHVLMAAGMAFMYLPVTTVPASFWQLVFAAAGVITAFWALGGIGRVATIIWLLTALDLSVMLLMWSGDEGRVPTPLIWLVVAYLALEAGLWLSDIYRRLDGSDLLINWQLLTVESDVSTAAVSKAVSGRAGTGRMTSAHATRAVTGETSGAGRLLGDLDITASMLVMAVGMAYMIVAMINV